MTTGAPGRGRAPGTAPSLWKASWVPSLVILGLSAQWKMPKNHAEQAVSHTEKAGA